MKKLLEFVKPKKLHFLNPWLPMFILCYVFLATFSAALGAQPQIATSPYHTVGLKSDGTVISVGTNYFYQLTDSSWKDITQIAANSNLTVGLKADGTVKWAGGDDCCIDQVRYWNDIKQVAAGSCHIVGIKSDGTVVTDGCSWYGGLDVSSWEDIIQVASADESTVGLKSDGTVVAVGWNQYGQLDVSSWKDIIQIATGKKTTVGLKSDGTVVAVGNNDHGQLNVSSWMEIVQVAVGTNHTVGLKSDGTVVAVGNNDHGQLNVSSWTEIIQIAAAGSHTVGLKSDGTVVAVGSNSEGQISISSWIDLTQIGAGYEVTAGVLSDGSVIQVGPSYYQKTVSSWKDIVQLAVGTFHSIGLRSDGSVTSAGFFAFDVSSWKDIIQVAAGENGNTLGLKSDGTVVAVGPNSEGELDVSLWADIIQIATRGPLSVGLKSDGTVVAVGNNDHGQLNVSSWTDIIQIAAGSNYTVGLKSDGTVVAVGSNYAGILNVSSWTDIIQIAAGGSHTVGLKSDGTVVAVGSNHYGQLDVSTWKEIIQVAAGVSHSIGLKSDGTVVAVGNNEASQCNLWNWNLGVQPAPFVADFDNDTEAFFYRDDVFHNTHHPSSASGSLTATGGYDGSGGLHVKVGNNNGLDIFDGMSGGWEKVFYLNSYRTIQISLKYRLMTSRYDPDECGEAFVAVDGNIIKNLVALCGGGMDSGWQMETFTQTLPAGNHTLTIGAHNNKKTGSLEKTDLYIDNVSLSFFPGYGPETICSNGLDDDGDGLFDCDDPDCADSGYCSALILFSEDFDTCEAGGFFYADDVFYGTTRPMYAHGEIVGLVPDGCELTVKLGNVDRNDILDGISGGWTREFYLNHAADVRFSLNYDMATTGFDADECAQVLVRIGNGPDEMLAELCGGGKDTGWQTKTFTRSLVAGPHTITMGGYNNKKTSTGEWASISFDNISAAIDSGIPSETICSNGLDDDGDGLFDCDDPDCADSPDCKTEPETICNNGLDDDGDGLFDCDDSDCADSGYCEGMGILFADFNGCEHAFAFVDDTFNGTSHPLYASGECALNGGTSGSAGLHVALGNVDGRNITDGMSGGWTGKFSLSTALDVQIIVDCRLVTTGFDADECAQVLVRIDNGPDEVLAELCGGGKDTGWQTKTFVISLSSGGHFITFGGYNNKKTGEREVADIYFDNLQIYPNTARDCVPPILYCPDSPIAYVGELFEIRLNATDLDTLNSKLTYGIKRLPAGATLDSANGIFRWVPDEEAAMGGHFGEYELNFTVTDDCMPPLSDSCLTEIWVRN